MNDLVIARYTEELDWIMLVPSTFRIHIYNKGAPIGSAALRARAATIVDRPNAGRESETYLAHMIEHGPGQGAFTVFSQGDPFEHSPDFLDLLETPEDWAAIQPLTWCWKQVENIPPTVLLETEADSPRVRPELFSLATWNPVQFTDDGAARTGIHYRALHGLPDGTNIAAHFFSLCGLPDLAAAAERHLVGRFAYGAIFAVRNKLIADLPSRALHAMHTAATGTDCYGYVLERLWLHLFGERFLLPATEPSIRRRCATTPW
ncbi:hypothetical protein [Nocardia sp. NPDC052566]|uniref:hypothetical protein n=1 Tax=Nocardia sp. NPDC052566 TaxID=3364330 RepID=UPI0037C7A7EA